MKSKIYFTLLLLIGFAHSLDAQSTIKEKLKNKYDNVVLMNSGYYNVSLNGKEGACDLSGSLVVPCIYDNVVLHSSGYYSVSLNEKEGACDLSGNLVVPCIYDDVVLYNGYYGVKLNGKKGACDLSGNLVVPCIYESLILSDGVYNYKENDKWIKIETTKNTKNSIESIPSKNYQASKNENQKQFFEGKSYQLQNTDDYSLSRVLWFGKYNKFTYSTYDPETQEETKKEGTYQYENGKLRIDFDDNQSATYNLTQLSKLKFSLVNNKESLIFAQLLSSEDMFFKNKLNNQLNNTNNGYNTYNSSNNSNSSTLKTKVCTACNGTGKGSGYSTVAAYGSTQLHWCAICNMNVSATHGEHYRCSVCKGSGTIESY